ncbi:MAG: OmpH family outer membrane protein [Ignavibacterium sp.]|nr:OmpH family outer membrane protein [Ignavibacterium sp.]MCX7610069.1 OmpH family outer membrane protein [Ignavibacterium sp.]MDW8374935.1 OmpH family outer membrane protein [Ignavibacteriales bacterium]
MKKYILFISILLSLNIFAQNGLKIGYVDSEIILSQYSEAIKAQGDLDAITSKWTAQLDSMTQAYQASIQDYQKKAETLKDDKKLEAQQKIIRMEQEILEFRRQKFQQGSGEIFKKQEEIFAPVKKKIYEAIKKVAKEENMSFVFDKSGDILLLYADEAFDITFKVLDTLRRGTN